MSTWQLSKNRLRWVLVLVVGLVLVSPAVKATPTVLSDQQLIEWARDTYLRADWIYAAIHMNALIQRNPPAVRNNPTFANELEKGLDFSIRQLQEAQRLANEYRQNSASTPSGGIGQVKSGISAAPPRIAWPK